VPAIRVGPVNVMAGVMAHPREKLSG